MSANIICIIQESPLKVYRTAFILIIIIIIIFTQVHHTLLITNLFHEHILQVTFKNTTRVHYTKIKLTTVKLINYPVRFKSNLVI